MAPNPEVVSWQSLVEKSQLPFQVEQCLIASGFATMASVSAINDRADIEKFFKKNHGLFTDADLRSTLYGIYSAIPEEFEFLPGHVKALDLFIQLCKKQCKKATKRQSTEEATSRLIQKFSRKMPNSVGPIPACGDSNGGTVELGQSSNSLRLSDESGSKLLEKEVFSDIKSKLATWCRKYSEELEPNSPELQLETHYKIIVQCGDMPKVGTKCEDEDGNIGPLLRIRASMLCLMCGAEIKLNIRKSSYTIANACRHLKTCNRKITAPLVTNGGKSCPNLWGGIQTGDGAAEVKLETIICEISDNDITVSKEICDTQDSDES